jgi:hypothetical protein
MSSRNTIQGVLDKFLGIFTSRYSDHDGYWIFGFFIEKPDSVCINLLETPVVGSSPEPLDRAKSPAVEKFRDQFAKTGVEPRCVREASLDISARLVDCLSKMRNFFLAR